MVPGRYLSSALPWRQPARRVAAIAAILIACDGVGSRCIAAQSTGIVSLTLSPATIAGGSGDTATGTVTLGAPAPSGGAIVTLASSNMELAATLPRVTVPEGEVSVTFAVATNAGYRRYSNLSFNVTISATSVTSRTATLTVTAQPRPPDFNSGSTAGATTQWDQPAVPDGDVDSDGNRSDRGARALHARRHYRGCRQHWNRVL